MYDKIEKLGNHTIQHGKHNNRIYLMKFSWENFPESMQELNRLANKNNYSKIFAKIPARALAPFLQDNYLIEAYIPKFYNETEDCLLVSKYFDEERKIRPSAELSEFNNLMGAIKNSNKVKYKHALKFVIRALGNDDAGEITSVYRKVFKTYPFPVFDKKYILKTMQEKTVLYFGVFDNLKLAGVSSAEIDLANKNAEMTDFAVLPEYRGQNLALTLLNTMETEMKIINIKTLYTIARLKSPGMNKTFLNAGYNFSGVLINNTNISGEIESMNVFYKHLL